MLAILGTRPEFRWYMDNYRAELVPFLHKYPQLVGELQRAVREGKIVDPEILLDLPALVKE